MISKKLKDEIWDYCRLNDITDINSFIERMVQQGYNIEKYGTAPMELKPDTVEKIVEVEVVKEVIKEVPVEKIVEKEVEVIKEVPVEVIKEVEKVVEKEVYVTDNETIQKLQEELELEIRTSKAQVKINEELVSVRDSLINEINEIKNDTTKDDRIKDLEWALEEERKKPKREKKEIKLPESTTRKSSIRWVSRDERDIDNLYDD